jgi:hypothetical protein
MAELQDAHTGALVEDVKSDDENDSLADVRPSLDRLHEFPIVLTVCD